MVTAKEKQLALTIEHLGSWSPEKEKNQLEARRAELARLVIDAAQTMETTVYEGKVLVNMRTSRAQEVALLKKPLSQKLQLMPYMSNFIEREGENLWSQLKGMETLQSQLRRSHSFQGESFNGNLTTRTSRGGFGFQPQTSQYSQNASGQKEQAGNSKLDSLLQIERNYQIKVKNDKRETLRTRDSQRRSMDDAKLVACNDQIAYYEMKKKGLLETLGKIQKALGNEVEFHEAPQYIISIRNKVDFMREQVITLIARRDQLVKMSVRSDFLTDFSTLTVNFRGQPENKRLILQRKCRNLS